MREEPGAWKPVSRRAGENLGLLVMDRSGKDFGTRTALSHEGLLLLLLSGSRGELPPLWFLKTSAGSQRSLLLFCG